ncbi:MAG: hypothetical protein M3O50_03805, partial [Myxococcota bacterium]|nr:hypothetical protein [Myxococcota bacterium]
VYLHASFISVASIYYLHAVDGGISFLVVVGLLIGHVGRLSGAWRTAALGLAVLLLFSLLDVRVNTNSLMSGVAAVITLYRTVRVPFGRGSEQPLWPIEPRRVCALAALTLVAILLRTSNAPAVLLFTALVFSSNFVLGARWPWTRETFLSLFRISGLLVGTFAIALLPWSILQKQSSGTYFFPFGHCNITPGWTLLTTPNTLGDEGRELLSHLFHGRPVALFVPFAIAGLVPLGGRARNDLACLSLGSLIGLAVFSHQAVAFGPTNTARYYFAFVAATSLLTAASAGQPVARAALVAAALGVHLVSSREETRGALDGYVTSAYHALSHSSEFDAAAADYLDVQSHVPPRATMVTAVFEGFRFDFKRNTIFALDVLGGMGPSPGWPAHQGPEALGAYLRTNGIQYLVYVDFNLPSEFYNRAHWTSHLNKTGSYLQGEAVLQLDAEDSIEKLTATRRVVYQSHGMTVVDLATAR